MIRALGFRDLHPEEVDDDAALFGEGLGLDSIDAMALSIMVRREYGVNLEQYAHLRAVYFRSVTALITFIRERLTTAQSPSPAHLACGPTP